jgi:P-type Ca2+ transporter type 2C
MGCPGAASLGLAYRAHADLEDRSGYIWAGLVAMQDPVREGVREAIAVAQHAGIKVKMITGDHRLTAEGIARDVGLEVGAGHVIEGSELTVLSDAQLQERVQDITVFARIRPQDKLRIVGALQARNEITAMIGDGVNDAPALKRANIGVVVGAATDIAKEQADLILLDNNFKTVVAAVEEGRVIFENIRKVVAYVLSNSFAEVLTIFGAMLLRWPTPLLISQILWIHLICDGPSDIVLGFEPKEDGILDEKPRSPQEPILDRLGLSLVGVISVVSAVVALVLFGHYWQAHNEIAEARSYAFAMFAVNPLIYVFGYRSLRRSTLRSGSLARNKPLVAAVAVGLAMAVGAVLLAPLRGLLGIVPLHPFQWVVVAAVAAGMLLTVDVAKSISRRVRAS